MTPPGPPRRATEDELLLAQVAQSLMATRAQAHAVMEQCDASLMVISTLQEREFQRIAALEAHQPDQKPAPKTFGGGKSDA